MTLSHFACSFFSVIIILRMDVLVHFSFEQYLGPMPLLTKNYPFELIKTDRHNNANFKWVNHMRLIGIIAERFASHMGCSPEDG